MSINSCELNKNLIRNSLLRIKTMSNINPLSKNDVHTLQIKPSVKNNSSSLNLQSAPSVQSCYVAPPTVAVAAPIVIFPNASNSIQENKK